MQITEIVTLVATILSAGWVSAVLVQLLKREQWPSWVKLVLSLVMAALVGFAAAWLSGDVTRFVTLWKTGGVTSDQFVAFAVLVYTAAAAWYTLYVKNTGWGETLARLGSKTV